MNEPLLGCDPSEVSPARAGAVFSDFAKQLAQADGSDFTAAWKRAKLLKPELHARMCSTEEPANTLANDTPPQPPVPLAQKAMLLPKFFLPPDTDDETFSQAFASNGYQTMTVKPVNIFLGLQTMFMKKNNIAAQMARRQIQDDYPELAKAAGQAIGQS